MHGVACGMGFNKSQQGRAQQGQIAHQIEHLVAHGLVFIAKGVVQGTVGAKDHGVLKTAAQGKATGTQLVDLLSQAERAGGTQLATVFIRGEAQLATLTAQGWNREIDDVAQAQAIEGEGANPATTVPDLHRLRDLHEAPTASKGPNARLQNGIHPGRGTAIENGQFLGIHFNAEVLDFHAGKG